VVARQIYAHLHGFGMNATDEAHDLQNPQALTVKFNIHNVAFGETMKARVHYLLGNRLDGRKRVAIYAKGFGSDLVSPTAVWG
jgi:hypothetical protein